MGYLQGDPWQMLIPKSIHTDPQVWEREVERRMELIKRARDWREAAIADGWTSEPTYPGHEDETSAFTLKRDGYIVMGLARDSGDNLLGTADISAWGPDGLAIPTQHTYDGKALMAGTRLCHYCGAEDVETVRIGFAGRSCRECAPAMRKKVEVRGWCD